MGTKEGGVQPMPHAEMVQEIEGVPDMEPGMKSGLLLFLVTEVPIGEFRLYSSEVSDRVCDFAGLEPVYAKNFRRALNEGEIGEFSSEENSRGIRRVIDTVPDYLAVAGVAIEIAEWKRDHPTSLPNWENRIEATIKRLGSSTLADHLPNVKRRKENKRMEKMTIVGKIKAAESVTIETLYTTMMSSREEIRASLLDEANPSLFGVQDFIIDLLMDATSAAEPGRKKILIKDSLDEKGVTNADVVDAIRRFYLYFRSHRSVNNLKAYGEEFGTWSELYEALEENNHQGGVGRPRRVRSKVV